jgi:hypothetical protein
MLNSQGSNFFYKTHNCSSVAYINGVLQQSTRFTVFVENMHPDDEISKLQEGAMA